MFSRMDTHTAKLSARVTLPSGNSIDRETWEWMRDAGTWHGFLDGRMYPLVDREFMDRELPR